MNHPTVEAGNNLSGLTYRGLHGEHVAAIRPPAPGLTAAAASALWVLSDPRAACPFGQDVARTHNEDRR